MYLKQTGMRSFFSLFLPLSGLVEYERDVAKGRTREHYVKLITCPKIVPGYGYR